MKTYTSTSPSVAIKDWAEADRPREKMLLYGNSALSNADLLAILINTGTFESNAIELAQQILDSVDGNLSELSRRSVKDLMKFKGIGEAKAISIAAALEVGRRRQFSDVMKRDDVTGAYDVYQLLSPMLIDLPHEEFWIVLLNQASHVIGKHRISSGGVAGVVVDAKLVFKTAIEYLASCLVLVHNHPSGELIPSKKDIELTEKLRQAGKTLDIAILDHVIISRSGYYSFVENRAFDVLTR